MSPSQTAARSTSVPSANWNRPPSFVNTWNDYMGPFIYLTGNRLWTVQLGRPFASFLRED